MEEDLNYTIKDIARLAGVSAGTVDRVLHNRSNVSEASREKVQRVLDEINYKPNVFAIGLAKKKRYHFVCVTPYYKGHDYWSAVATGIKRAGEELAPFNVHVDFIHYHHANRVSYDEACQRALEQHPDAVLLAPNFREDTIRLTQQLDEQRVAYALVDFNVEDTHPICYIGQDSKQSGWLTAKMLLSRYQEGDELAIFLNNQKFSPAEIQMQRRLEGFMQYVAEKCDHLSIFDVILDKEDDEHNRKILDKFFAAHPQATLGTVFNSRIYQVARYLKETGREMKSLAGYDLLTENVELLKQGRVSFLLGQRPALQGYLAIKALCDHVVFKKEVTRVKYMPIDLLVKENIDYYFEMD